MVIGVDLDGVVADFNSAYINLVRRLTGRDLFPAGYHKDIIETWSYPESFGYTKEEITGVWDWIAKDDEFWFNLKPLEGAEEFLTWLHYEEMFKPHDVYFITSRIGYAVKSQSEEWLVQHGWGGSFDPTVLISSEKGECCHALKIDYYIDDKNENCADVRAKSPKTTCFMLARPWNSIKGIAGVWRIPDLATFQNDITLQEGEDNGKQASV